MSVNIGDTYEGGKVGYILQPGDYGYDSSYQKGIIVYGTYLGPTAWAGNTSAHSVMGITSNEYRIGYGKTITTSVYNSLSYFGDFSNGYGAFAVVGMSLGGYADWYLPTKNELQQIYYNRSILGLPSDAYYWSITSTSTSAAYTLYFPTNTFYSENIWDSIKTLPCRNFSISLVAPPTVTTQLASTITLTTAVGNGTVVNIGSSSLTERGICWNTSSDPTTTNNKGTSSGTTGAYTVSMTGLTGGNTYYVRAYAINSYGTSYGNQISFFTSTSPSVTTEAVSATSDTTAVGNGTVVSDNYSSIIERGICIGTSTNPTTSGTKFTTSGTTGSFSVSLTSLTRNTLYHVRAYAINSIGTSYGTDTTFTTSGWLNPTNAYTSDNTYTTLGGAISGELGVSLSTDGGANYTPVLTKTFTVTEQYLTYGAGSTELWGTTLNGDNIDNTDLRLKITHNGISQVYKNFGFSIGAGTILTGFEVSIEAKYASSTLYVDHIRAKIYYGTSVIEVKAGAQAYASNGRTGTQTAGNGTGVLCYFNGTSWKATDSGNDVVA